MKNLTTWAAERNTGTSRRHLIVLKHRRAIHNHKTNPYWKLVRLVESRLIRDRVLVEDDQVRRESLSNQTTIAKSKCLRRQRRHFPNRVLQRDQLQLAHITP